MSYRYCPLCKELFLAGRGTGVQVNRCFHGCGKYFKRLVRVQERVYGRRSIVHKHLQEELTL